MIYIDPIYIYHITNIKTNIYLIFGDPRAGLIIGVRVELSRKTVYELVYYLFMNYFQ